MTPRVTAIPLADDLIAHVADRAFADGAPLERLCFVFGGRRPGLFLKRELARRAGGPLRAPSILTIEELLSGAARRLRPARTVSETDAAWILYRLAREHAPGMLKEREGFARFHPWAVELAALIRRLDREAVPDERLRAVQQSAEIGYEVPAAVNALLRSIADLRSAFHAELDRRGLTTSGKDALLAAQRADEVTFPEHERVYFCGLFSLHATERTLLSSLLARDIARLVFQGGAGEWPVLAGLERVFGEPIRAAAAEPPVFTLYAGADAREQAALARSLLEQAAVPERTVFVVPDGAALVPVLAELSPSLKDFNVSLGYPAEQSSLYELLEAVFAAQLSRTAEGYGMREYLQVLLHPLAKNMRFSGDPALTRIVAHKVEEGLAGAIEGCPLAGRAHVALAAVEQDASILASAAQFFPAGGKGVAAVGALLRDLHAAFFSAWERAETYGAAAEALERMIDALGARGFLGDHPLNAAVAERVLEAAGEIGRSLLRDERPAPEELYAFLLDRLGGESVALPGSPLRGLQVLGALEARNIAFDTVVMMDLNESVVPQVRRVEALVPAGILPELGLPPPAVEEEIQRYHFRALLAPARAVHLIYARTAEHERSRFIEQLLWEEQKRRGTLTVPPVLQPRSAAGPAPAPESFAKTPAMAHFLAEKFIYSATSIDMYLHCPQRFFFRYVCGLREQYVPGAEPDAAEIGTFVHALMQEACAPFVGARPAVDTVFRDRFDALLRARFARTLAPRLRGGGFLLEELLARRLRRFLEREEERLADVACLRSVEERFSGAIAAGGRDFAFAAQMDRIEELTDRSLRIVDIKTGSVTPVAVRPERLRGPDGACTRASVRAAVGSFQLYLYRTLFLQRHPGTVAEACLVSVRGDGGAAGLFRAKAADAEHAAVLSACAEGLAFLLTEIADPAVPFAADRTDGRACGLCPFRYACR